MMSKCKSCQSGFDVRNGNGYSPCGCAMHIRNLSEPEMRVTKSIFRKQMEEHLGIQPLFSKRNQIKSNLDNASSQPLDLLSDGEFEYIPPFYHKAFIYLLMGIAIGYLVGRFI